MREKINEEVSVVMYYSARRRQAIPHTISWQNKEYFVGAIGFHHTIKDGEILHHIFEITDRESKLSFRLNFNTQNLHWLLEVVSDGLPS